MTVDEILEALTELFNKADILDAHIIREVCNNSAYFIKQQQSEFNRLQQENEQLKAGREIIEAQAQAIEFKAKKNAEAYKRLKCELNSINTIFSEVNKQNEQLKELLRLVVDSIEKCCDTCKNDNTENQCGYKTVCRNRFYKNWQWQHEEKLKGVI